MKNDRAPRCKLIVVVVVGGGCVAVLVLLLVMLLLVVVLLLLMLLVWPHIARYSRIAVTGSIFYWVFMQTLKFVSGVEFIQYSYLLRFTTSFRTSSFTHAGRFLFLLDAFFPLSPQQSNTRIDCERKQRIMHFDTEIRPPKLHHQELTWDHCIWVCWSMPFCTHYSISININIMVVDFNPPLWCIRHWSILL